MIYRSDLKADLPATLKHMGYPPGATPPAKVMDRLRALTETAKTILLPMVFYHTFPIQTPNVRGAVHFPETAEAFTSPFAAAALKGCREVIIAVATIKDKTEKQALDARSTQRPASDQLILKSIANAGLESLVEAFWNDMAAQSRCDAAELSLRDRGLGGGTIGKSTGLTRIYLPGENAWPIADQAILFRLLRAKEPALSVRLNDSLMMDPENSLSFVIGKTLDGTFSEVHHDCGLCLLKGCQFRKETKSSDKTL